MSFCDLRREVIVGATIKDIPSWSSFHKEQVPIDYVDMTGYFYYREEVLVGYYLMSLHKVYFEAKDEEKSFETYLFDEMKKHFAEINPPCNYCYFSSRPDAKGPSRREGDWLVVANMEAYFHK